MQGAPPAARAVPARASPAEQRRLIKQVRVAATGASPPRRVRAAAARGRFVHVPLHERAAAALARGI
jgi:hypothetical protein